MHYSFADIAESLANIRDSSSTGLLTTTFPDEPANVDITSGDRRPVTPTQPPFGVLSPREPLHEPSSEGGGRSGDKSPGLRRVADLPGNPAP